ncbi:MAG: 1-acyl-sn-glycerol-3-phosphate acyltransferase [Pseudomonadales bacterium]|nr:1-acyl-sn-glycerol-3-phosphate acyltransferase [Pseudomonadales bacterium]
MLKVPFSLYLRTALFYVVLVIFTFVFTSTAIIIAPALPYRTRFVIVIQGYTKFVINWLRICCNINYQIYGVENIPKDPCIIYSKHQSTWETFFLQTQFAPQTQVIKQELLKIPFFGWAFGLVEPIAIDRSNRKEAIRTVLREGTEKLNQGVWVLIFPEGTRVPTGRRKKFTRGGAKLAISSGKPLLPVAHNSGERWPNNSLLKYPGTVSLVYGQPIDPFGKTEDQLTQEAEHWINTTSEELNRCSAEDRLFSPA